MSDLRDAVIELVRRKALEHRDEPFRLSSGQMSHDYFDGKRALAGAADLRLAVDAIIALARERDISFDTVGGMTMGADALSHGIALVSGASWFTVRKEAKSHGKQRRIEGVDVRGTRALLVDDIVTTGGSIEDAIAAALEEGAQVELAVCLVDRSGQAADRLGRRGVAFAPICTWRDLDIEPVGDGRVDA